MINAWNLNILNELSHLRHFIFYIIIYQFITYYLIIYCIFRVIDFEINVPVIKPVSILPNQLVKSLSALSYES